MLSVSKVGARTPLSPLTQTTLEKHLPGLPKRRFLQQASQATTCDVGCITGKQSTIRHFGAVFGWECVKWVEKSVRRRPQISDNVIYKCLLKRRFARLKPNYRRDFLKCQCYDYTFWSEKKKLKSDDILQNVIKYTYLLKDIIIEQFINLNICFLNYYHDIYF